MNRPAPSRLPAPLRHRPRRLHGAAAAAAPLALAATLAGAGATGRAATAAVPTHTRATAAPAVALTGLHASSYTVTLITGDHVKLTAAGAGRYTVTAIPAPGSTPAINVAARGGPAGTGSVYAVPVTAESLIASGQLNRGLFDVSYLAAHGDTSASGRIPVTIRYAGHPGAAALAARARDLAGARLAAVAPGSGEAKVSVAAGRAAAFWAALTGGTAAMPAWPRAAARLAGGAASVWLPGHQVPALSPPSRPSAGQPLATVTETITRKHGQVFSGYCGTKTTLCLETDPTLLGVAGGGAGNFYPGTVTCADTNPCDTYRVQYRVPPGVYSTGAFGIFFVHDQLQSIDLLNPQITVAGNTQFTTDADTAQQVTVSGPQPTAPDTFGASFGDYRSLPDGTFYVSFSQSAYGYQNNWYTTGGGRVTVGAFHLLNMIVAGPPPVTMAVTAPEHLALNALYPFYTAGPENSPFTRFSGRHTLTLADAGYGRPKDFAGHDFRGKLILLRLYGFTCGLITDVAQRARTAGAAGILIDATTLYDPAHGLTRSCTLPILPNWWEPSIGGSPVRIPFAAITPAQASKVRGLLAHGPVRISVDDGGPARYLYAVSPAGESRLPATEHYRFISRQLTADTENFYATGSGQEAAPGWAAFRPDDYLVGGSEYDFLADPGSVRVYTGPDSPDTVWWRDPYLVNRQGPFGDRLVVNVFGQHGGQMTTGWYTLPAVPGVPAAELTAARQAQPGRWGGTQGNSLTCAGCRQGDTFYPFFYEVPGANPLEDDTGHPYAAGSTDIHLYDAAGHKIQQTSSQGIATYTLPSRQARYRLTTQDGNASTTWDFTSSRPASDQTPAGFACLGTSSGASTAPCRADPLVFLRYNAFTSLADSVTAPATHQLRVTAYYQAPGRPAVTRLKLWTSTDGGKTWQAARVTGGSAGTFTATYSVPAVSSTNGSVSIKAQAADAAGNSVTQIIRNAYPLASGKDTRR